MTSEIVHATCVSIEGKGVLLRGPSGSGKSDLALRLIDRGALLVADDLVELVAENDIRATFPTHAQAQSGVMEIRGLGLMRVPHVAEVTLHLVIDLSSTVERYPGPQTGDILGVMIPRLTLNPFEASAVAKIVAALSWERVDD